MKAGRIANSLVLAAALFAVTAISPVRGADVDYRLIAQIPVGGEGGWDYASVDAAARRLYVTHATKVIVIDLDKNIVIGEVADTPGVHGFALAPELGLGFSSNGQENKASIVDLKTLKTLSKVETGQNPDSILYVPGLQEVYTFNGRGKSATVFEAKSGKVIATIPLPGKPEFPQLDIKAGRIYNNIEDTNQVVAIDIKKHAVTETWPIAPGEEPTGMAIDLAGHRLFLGCGNSMMVMMDSTSGKVLGSIPTGPGVDGAAFDPGTKLAFASSGGAGTVTIAREETPGKLAVLQVLKTARGSRTMTIDPTTHNIYLAAVDYEAAATEPAPGGQKPRPKAVPGSFKVLVFGMGAAK